MQKDPNDADECDKHIEAVATTLPVASESQRHHFHHDLRLRKGKEKTEKKRTSNVISHQSSSEHIVAREMVCGTLRILLTSTDQSVRSL